MNHSIPQFLKKFRWEPMSTGTATLWQDTTQPITDRGNLDEVFTLVEELESTWSDETGRGQRNEVLDPFFADESIFVKQYHHGGLLAGKADVHYDSPERFLSELKGSLRAHQVGVHAPTPRAVIYFEDSDGFRGFYLSRFVESTTLSYQLRQNTDRQSLLDESGSVLARLHDAGIDHQDFHITNLAFDELGSLLVTDFDPVEFGDLGRGRRERRVQRFIRSLDKRGFGEEEAERFRTSYWEESGIDEPKIRRALFGALNSVKNTLSDTLYNMRDRPIREEDLERVLIRAPNWLGDTVMSMPFLEAIEEHVPETTIDVAVRNSLVDVYRLHPSVNEVHTLPDEKTWSLPDLSDYRYSSMIVLPKSLRTGIQAYTSGIPRRIGFATQGRSLFLTDRVPLENADREIHHARLFFRLLEDVLPEPDRPTVERFPKDEAFDDVEDLRPESDYLTVHPGTAYGPAKRWPPERFGECLLRLSRKTQKTIVALGVEDEREIARDVLEPLESDDCLNLVGETSLPEAIRVLTGSQGTIANDSGIMHLSAALGTPTLGVFGSSDPSLTHPVGPVTDYVYENVECSPCFERECPLDEDRYKCLEGIESERVFERFLTLIQG